MNLKITVAMHATPLDCVVRYTINRTGKTQMIVRQEGHPAVSVMKEVQGENRGGPLARLCYCQYHSGSY